MDPREHIRKDIRMALTCAKSTHDVPRYDPGYGLHTVYIHYDALPHFEAKQTALVGVWGHYLAGAKDIPDGKDFMWSVRVLVQGRILPEHFVEADLLELILLMGWPLSEDGERRALEIQDKLQSGIVEDTDAPATVTDIGLRFRSKDDRIVLVHSPQMDTGAHAPSKAPLSPTPDKETHETDATAVPMDAGLSDTTTIPTKRTLAEELCVTGWRELEAECNLDGLRWKRKGAPGRGRMRTWAQLGLEKSKGAQPLLIELAQSRADGVANKKTGAYRALVARLNKSLRVAVGLSGTPITNVGGIRTRCDFLINWEQPNSNP